MLIAADAMQNYPNGPISNRDTKPSRSRQWVWIMRHAAPGVLLGVSGEKVGPFETGDRHARGCGTWGA